MKLCNKLFKISILGLIPASCLMATTVGFIHQNTIFDTKNVKDKKIKETKVIPTDKFKIVNNVLYGFNSEVKFQDLAVYNTLQIPSTVKEIKANAFSNMFDHYFTILKLDLTQATNLEVIGDAAFLNCYAFGAPASSTIDFSHCTNLKTIGIDAFSGCEVLGDDQGELDFTSCTQLTKIGSSAFRYGHFQTLKLPESLQTGEIGALAFSNCTELKTIDFSNLNTIPTWMYNSRNLFSNVVEEGSTLTDRKVFINVSKYTDDDWKEVFIRQDVPFNDGSTTTNFDIQIENKLDLADETYFKHDSGSEQGVTITEILPAGITALQKANVLFISKNIHGIDDSVSFKDLITPNQYRDSVSLVFESPETSKFTSFSKGQVSNDANGCFMGCTALSGRIVFPKNLKTMPVNAFNGCTKLKELDFSKVVLTSGESQENSFVFDTSCFANCTSLRKVIFPNMIANIYLQKQVFMNDSHISILDFTSSGQCNMKAGSDLSGAGDTDWPFYKISKYGLVVASSDNLGFLDRLKVAFHLDVGEENAYWKYSIPSDEKSWDLENYATTGNYTLFGFKKEKLDSISSINCVKIPESILTISDKSFDTVLFSKENDWNKWTLKLNNGLQIIGNRAFANDCHLNGCLNIPETVTSIGDEAFYKCSGFVGEFNLPSNIKTIGSKAFAGCKNMWNTELIIPSSVEEIGSCAFGEMSLIQGIKFEVNTNIKLGSCVFGEMSGLTTLDFSAFETDEQFNQFLANADVYSFHTNLTAGTHKVIVPSGKTSAWKESLKNKGLDVNYQWTTWEEKASAE